MYVPSMRTFLPPPGTHIRLPPSFTRRTRGAVSSRAIAFNPRRTLATFSPIVSKCTYGMPFRSQNALTTGAMCG